MNFPLADERFPIATRMSPEEVMHRLRDVTDPGKLTPIRCDKSKLFRASVSDREFRVTRIIR